MFALPNYRIESKQFMSWKNIDKFNIKDSYEGIELDEIQPLSERAASLIARRKNQLILKHAFINIYGAVEMMQGLTYHHASFMRLIESCCTTAPTLQTESSLRHEAIAYLNRVGQFWSFAKSDLVKDCCPVLEEMLPTLSTLIVFRNKHTAHRSIDSPRAEDTKIHQVMNAVSLSVLGPKFFRPKSGHISPDLFTENTDIDLDEYKRSLYRNSYLGFQIQDVKHSAAVNFYIERDHEVIMGEAYSLIRNLLSHAED